MEKESIKLQVDIENKTSDIMAWVKYGGIYGERSKSCYY